MRITLRVKKLDNPRRVAYMRILRRIGSGCLPGEPVDAGEEWVVPFDAYMPSVIVDERRDIEKKIVFHLSDVGKIQVNKKTLKIKKSPSLSEVKYNIQQRRSQAQKLVEEDLIKVLGDPKVRVGFGVLKYAFTGLQPIYRITVGLLQEEEYLTSEKIEEEDTYQDFINFMIQLGYAEYSERKLIPTNKMYQLNQMMGDVIETAHMMIGIMLSNYYEYLIKTMRIIHFVPYLRLSASYYSDAVQFGELISISKNRLKSNMGEYYKGAPHVSIRRRLGIDTMINELVDARILSWSKELITGRPEIFERLVGVREEFPISDQPYAY